MVSPREPLTDLQFKVRDVIHLKLGDYILVGVEQVWGISSRIGASNRADREINEAVEAIMKLLRFKQEDGDANQG